MVAGHRQLPVGSDGAVGVPSRLEGGLPLRLDLAFRLVFQVI